MSSLERPQLRSGLHHRGYLPHWKEDGRAYFVTFRLAGTLPRALLEELRHEKEALLARERTARVSETVERLRRHHAERIEAYLDAGLGECWLKRPDIGGLVCDALRHFDGGRYDLHAWTVMPNHVHVVVTPLAEHTLSGILHSWKSFTALRANRHLGRAGQPFWQTESYDGLIRDEKHLARACDYTERNPVAAGLCEQPEDWPWGSAHDRLAERPRK